MVENTLVTMFSHVKWDKAANDKPQARLIALSKVFDRIKSEKMKSIVEQVRAAETKEKGDEIKRELPVICFSGEFKGHRDGKNLVKHSGLIVLDFDKMTPDEIEMRKEFLIKQPFVVAAFVSPSGKGLKVVIRIADGSKHDAHYRALLKDFPDADPSTKDVARACFDCADKDIYINYNAKPYTKIVEVERVSIQRENKNGNTDFSKIEKWLEKKNKVYESGNRNNYIFALASACCRFGIDEKETEDLICQNYLSKDTDFTVKEMCNGIKSAYSRNKFASAAFSNDVLVERESTKEVEIDLCDDVADVVYAEDCYNDALEIFRNGYASAEATGIKQIDRIFKWKRGELTVLTGIGNFGKSAMLSFLMLNKSEKDGTKWAVFSPENFPAHEFYHDLCEMYVGANCSPVSANGEANYDKPREDIYEKAYKFVGEHFFYIYPKDLSPTPEYIRSRFLELIIKEKVDGVVIDPFNQLANDYGGHGRDDKYLESFLSECCRFAIKNNVYYVIIAHPHKLQKDRDTKAYPCPDVFDLAGGAMWNNKADNILVYHRPNHHTDPMDRTCELHSKKIRRQKIVGEKGVEQFDYSRRTRRFVFDDYPIKRVDLGISNAQPMRDFTISQREAEDDDTPF